MAIEIIERSSFPEIPKYEGQCGNCKSVLRWYENDAEYAVTHKTGHAKSTIVFTVCVCPVCGFKVEGAKI